MILAGDVQVNGTVCDDPRTAFDPDGLTLTVDGVAWKYRAHAYVMLHKPPGYECSQKPQHHPSVLMLLPVELRLRGIQCIGRLDQDTTGLLLLSDDGQFIHRYSSSKRKVPKVYEVQTDQPVEAEQLVRLRDGVTLEDEPEPVAAQSCEQTGPNSLRLTLTQGKYHQVKRMVVAAGNHVVGLHRSAVGGLALPDSLPCGEWAWLEADDLVRLAGQEAGFPEKDGSVGEITSDNAA